VHTPNEDKSDNMKDTFCEELECIPNQFPKYHMKIWRIQFKSREREDIFKPIRKGSLHDISNNNGVRIINLATSKNLNVRSTMCPRHNIHKYP
jgi:hypothetical protein